MKASLQQKLSFLTYTHKIFLQTKFAYIDFIPDSHIEYAQEYNTRNQETEITNTYVFSLKSCKQTRIRWFLRGKFSKVYF